MTNLQKTRDEFIDVGLIGDTIDPDAADATAAKPKPKRIKKKRRRAPGLILREGRGGEPRRRHRRAPAEPAGLLPEGDPRPGRLRRGQPAPYDIFDRNKNKYRAYRIVLSQGDNGQYYGVQGTTWKAPPILDNPTDEVRMRKRTYQRYFDGHRLRLIAWKTPRAVYWVSNTLSKS